MLYKNPTKQQRSISNIVVGKVNAAAAIESGKALEDDTVIVKVKL